MQNTSSLLELRHSVKCQVQRLLLTLLGKKFQDIYIKLECNWMGLQKCHLQWTCLTSAIDVLLCHYCLNAVQMRYEFISSILLSRTVQNETEWTRLRKCEGSLLSLALVISLVKSGATFDSDIKIFGFRKLVLDKNHRKWIQITNWTSWEI